MSLELPPLRKWPGGKARMTKRIIRTFPKDYDTYVEPFAGGAAVYFRVPLKKKMVLGDADKDAIVFLDKVRRGGLRRCRGGIRASRGLFDRSKKNDSACYELARSTLSYHGDRSTYGASSSDGKVLGGSKLRRLPDYEKKLRRTHLTVGDFAKTMRKHDSKRAVHFLDPPWPLDSDYSAKYKGQHLSAAAKKAMDPEHVVDVSAKMKGFVYIIYGDHPSVRKAFRRARREHGFEVYEGKIATNRGSGGMEGRTNLVAIKRPFE